VWVITVNRAGKYYCYYEESKWPGLEHVTGAGRSRGDVTLTRHAVNWGIIDSGLWPLERPRG